MDADPPGDDGLGVQLIQVAFAGHNRPDDLGDTASLERDLREAFRLIAAAGVGKARLLTGYARGADRLAANLWQASGLGPIHVVEPFLAGIDETDHQAPFALNTRLDGVAIEAVGQTGVLDMVNLIGAYLATSALLNAFQVPAPSPTEPGTS